MKRIANPILAFLVIFPALSSIGHSDQRDSRLAEYFQRISSVDDSIANDALNSIGSIDDAALLKECFVSLVEKDHRENEKAERAMKRLGKISKKLPHLMLSLKEGIAFVVDSVSTATWEGRRVMKALQVTFDSFDHVRIREPMTVAVRALIQALKFRDQDRRADAAELLGRMGEISATAIPDLISVLKLDDYYRARGNAVVALGEIGKAIRLHDRDLQASVQEYIFPGLVSALGDPEPWVREKAARGLEQLGPIAVSAIRSLQEVALHDHSPQVRAAATHAIVRLAP